jgi:Tat protein secretion system quality control protein TatD with DNase activity
MSAYIHAVDHPIIDIGLNLTSFKYEHRIEQVLQNASSANVSHILITGTNIRKSLHAIVIAKKYQNVNNIQLNTTFGVHPHDAKHASNTEKLKKQIRDAIKQNNGIIKAVGECGLDFNRMFSPKDVQIQVRYIYIYIPVMNQFLT